MRKILITSGSSLIGNHLINQLNGFKIKTNIKSNYDKIFFNKDIELTKIDYLKKKLPEDFTKNIYAVIHTAGVDEEICEKNYNIAKKINLCLIKKLLENCIRNKVKKFIKISTYKTYGNKLNGTINERTPTKTNSNYSKLHALSDKYLINKKNCQIDIIILKLSNGFGIPLSNKKEKWKNILNNFCYQAINERMIKISSNVNLYKNFIPISLVAKVIIFFIKNKKKINGIFNVGNKKNHNLLEIATKIKKNLKKNNIDIEIFNNFSKKNKNFNFSISKLGKIYPLIKKQININSYIRALLLNLLKKIEPKLTLK